MRFSILLSISLLIGFANPTMATEPHTTLKKLNEKIASIKASLSLEQNKRNTYLQSLKTTEMAAGQALLKLQQTSQTLHQQQTVLKKLTADENNYQNKLTIQQNALAAQIRSAYLLGRQPYLKLALNQTDADRISRLLIYYRYISQTRVDVIQDLQQTLGQMQNTQAQIKNQTQVLSNLQTAQQNEQQKLENLKQARQTLIAQLNTEITNKTQKLNTLLENKRLLEQTIHRLAQPQTSDLDQQNFASLQGHLTWPTQGQVLPYFGTKIYQSELTWDGVLINAKEDQPVYAVAKGQVAFAKWLPGYGLLLIISHGHGYMTLYGRNHNIYKKAGDMVKAGDLIATVGNSGGYENPSLYFAIRHNAVPLNPTAWCHAK